MKLIYNEVFLQHDTGMHPENKKRLEVFEGLESVEIPFDESVPALVHTADYIKLVKEASGRKTPLDPDTMTSEGSYQAAVYAANATMMAAESGDFALVRPPGHHAYPHHSSGFCIFNNVAIAARKLADEGKKVLIFDFDGHLGDGTVNYFYESDQVMYWSLHQFPAFPGGGDYTEIGKDKGRGFTINVPLPAGSADDVFFRAIESFLPVARQFDPDVVAVSAGFDASKYDLLLNLKLSHRAFYRIGKLLKDNFKNIFATLEGGYNIAILQKLVQNFIDGCNGDEISFPESATESDVKVIQDFDIMETNLYNSLKSFWSL